MPKLYTVEALADLFSRTGETIRDWIEEGLFPHAFKIKDGWYVPEQDIQALMGKEQNPPEEGSQPKLRRPSGGGFVKGWK